MNKKKRTKKNNRAIFWNGEDLQVYVELFHTPSSSFYHFHPHFHPRSSIFNHFQPLSSNFIPFRPISSIFIYFYNSITITIVILYCLTHIYILPWLCNYYWKNKQKWKNEMKMTGRDTMTRNSTKKTLVPASWDAYKRRRNTTYLQLASASRWRIT